MDEEWFEQASLSHQTKAVKSLVDLMAHIAWRSPCRYTSVPRGRLRNVQGDLLVGVFMALWLSDGLNGTPSTKIPVSFFLHEAFARGSIAVWIPSYVLWFQEMLSSHPSWGWDEVTTAT